MKNENFNGRDKSYEDNITNELETKWNNIAPSYREKYPTLTEDDVDYREGEFDSMTDRIAKRTNRRREDVLSEIRDWDDDNSY